MTGVHELTPALGASAACRALGLWRGAPARQRACLRRAQLVGPRARRAARARPPLALGIQERQLLLDTLNGERFVDTAPAAVHATLLDEGRYLGSVISSHSNFSRACCSTHRLHWSPVGCSLPIAESNSSGGLALTAGREARWPHFKAQAHQSTIGQLVADAMARIEPANPR